MDVLLPNYNTRLIIATLGLVYIAVSGAILVQMSTLLQLQISLDLQFYELMRLADPDRQPPDHQAQLTIIETNWVTRSSSCSLPWFACSRYLARSNKGTPQPRRDLRSAPLAARAGQFSFIIASNTIRSM